MIRVNAYPHFDALSDDLSKRWLKLIANTPADQPCSFALAGGTTPEPLYRQFDSLFSKTKSRKIQLVATDERWVPDADPQSNEGLFQRCFTQSAPNWNLVTLKNKLPTPTEALAAVNFHLNTCLPKAFNAVILGMGSDGHIASLFPNAPKLLIDDASINCVAARHPQTGQERISLSFSRLLKTDAIWLVITGEEKSAVLEDALTEKNPLSPIGALLAAAHCDVEVFWCQ